MKFHFQERSSNILNVMNYRNQFLTLNYFHMLSNQDRICTIYGSKHQNFLRYSCHTENRYCEKVVEIGNGIFCDIV